MCDQSLFDLARIDLEAGDDDHLLLAIDDREVPVIVEARDVARVEPAIAQRQGGLVRPLVVTVHELRPAQDQLAGLARAHVLHTRVEIDDPRLDVGERDTDRADLLLALAKERIAMRHRRGFREAVSLDELRTGQLDEPAMGLAQQRG